MPSLSTGYFFKLFIEKAVTQVDAIFYCGDSGKDPAIAMTEVPKMTAV